MRTIGYNGSGKTVAATTAQTITFNSSDMPSNRLVAAHLGLTAGGNTLADVDRVRVKAGGATIYDLTMAQLRGLLEATTPPHLLPATTDQSFTIPFYDLTQPYEELQDQQQFPGGQPITVEVVLNTGSAAGLCYIGWTQTDQNALYYPRLLSTATGLPVTIANGRVPFQALGQFRGFSIPTAGLTRLRCVVSGEEVLQVAGSLGASSASLLFESLRCYSGGGLTDPLWALFKSGMPGVNGNTFIEMDTTSAAAAGEICIYDQVPLQ